MLSKFVNTAAQVTANILNGLSERIDRAGHQVMKSHLNTKRGPKAAFNVQQKTAKKKFTRKNDEFETSKETIGKLNETMSKDIQHHRRTSRHS